MRNVNLFVLGVQKCGTTSLSSHLNSHPEIFIPSIKETYFFCLEDKFSKGVEWYEGEFYAPRSAAQARYRGDATPFYLASEEALRRIAAYCGPEARFVVLLRDPVSRAMAAYRHQVRLGNEPMTFEQALDAESTRIADGQANGGRWWRHAYANVGRYGEQLERAFDLLGRERILVLSPKDLQDVAPLNQRLVDFLGLQTPFAATVIPRENPASVPRSIFVRNLITKPNAIKSIASAIVPREIRTRIGQIINKKNLSPAEDFHIESHVYQRLYDFFVSDQERLASIGVDAGRVNLGSRDQLPKAAQ